MVDVPEKQTKPNHFWLFSPSQGLVAEEARKQVVTRWCVISCLFSGLLKMVLVISRKSHSSCLERELSFTAGFFR